MLYQLTTHAYVSGHNGCGISSSYKKYIKDNCDLRVHLSYIAQVFMSRTLYSQEAAWYLINVFSLVGGASDERGRWRKKAFHRP